MTRKILKVGTSAADTIPKESLKELGLKIGDRVMVKVDRQKRMVSIRPIARELNKELIGWTEKFIERYRPAPEALAKK